MTGPLSSPFLRRAIGGVLLMLVSACFSPVILAQTPDRAQLGNDLARFQELYRLNPDDPAVNHDLGLALELSGRPTQAIRHYHRARSRQPDDASLLVSLGRCNRQTGDMEHAIRLLEKAVRLAPGDIDAWYELAMARADLGLLTEAGKALQHVLALHPSGPREGYIRLYIATLALSSGDRETALREQKALSVCDPARAETLAALLAMGE